MKILGVLIFMAGFSALADNPQIRACRLTEGTFHVVALEEDQFGFCEYGSAMMDSYSIFDSILESTQSLAVEAFLDSSECTEAQGYVARGTDLEGKNFDICKFSDGSMIENETLEAGPQAGSNAQLMKALQSRF